MPAINDASTEQTDLPNATRKHGEVDFEDGTVYKEGTADVPQEIQDVVARIKALRTNAKDFPFRKELNQIKEHFQSRPVILRRSSTLWPWYGDTRLFSRAMWHWLATNEMGD